VIFHSGLVVVIYNSTASELAVSWCRNDTAFSCLALLVSVSFVLAIPSTIQRYDKGMTIPNRLAVSPTSKLGVSLPYHPPKNVNISAPNLVRLCVVTTPKISGVSFHHMRTRSGRVVYLQKDEAF
jgi:hypothetical protein